MSRYYRLTDEEPMLRDSMSFSPGHIVRELQPRDSNFCVWFPKSMILTGTLNER